MFAFQRLASRLFLIAVVLGLAGSGRMATAQDRPVPKSVPQPRQPPDVGDDGEAQDRDLAENVNQPQEDAELTREQIDQLCAFASDPGAGSARARLESLLALQIETIERTCGITEVQRKKLQLAGRGDIKRFFDRLDENKRKLILARRRPDEVARIQVELGELESALQRGFFDDRSLFAKTRKQTMSEEQRARLKVRLDESRRFRHQAKIDVVVNVFDACIGFRDEQRQRLTKLLLAETRLPKENKSGTDEIVILILQAIKAPEARLRPIFEDSQWRSVCHLFKQLKEQLKRQLDDADLKEANLDLPDDPGAGPVNKAEPVPPQEKNAEDKDH